MDNDKMPNKPSFTSVKEYGIFFDQNWQHRRKMEDAHFIQDGFAEDPNNGFFAIYDGHGGKEAAVFSSNNLHKILHEQLKQEEDAFSKPESVLKHLKKTFELTDQRMKESGVPSHHGCTAVVCLITGKNDQRNLFAANVGDTRAILCRDGKALRITQDHTVSNEQESKRIQDKGGFIMNGRVNGQIIITRSLGDHLMKDYITSDPYVYFTKLGETDSYLILACDGLWDVVDDQKAVDFILENSSNDTSVISKKLIALALKEGSTDNLTVSVIKL